jgi:hypothetical protein
MGRPDNRERIMFKQAKIAAGLVLTAILTVLPAVAMAIPSLQLDIQGGIYDPTTQTIVGTSDSFSLYAYLIPDAGAPLSEPYYISAAIVPQTGPAPATLGSFTFNGSPVVVTGTMSYGNPPIDVAETIHDGGDLSPHGIFETYFKEFQFSFTSTNRATAYNTQDTPGVGPTPDPSGPMYFAAFPVDVSGLTPGYAVHFDLYNETFRQRIKCTGPPNNQQCTVLDADIDVNSFAPFSHDAESGKQRVPEPLSLVLLGAGVLTAGLFARRIGIKRPRP